MRITMTDIARAANTSVSTVGRVLHENGYVSGAVRTRIERAISELGYVPNQSARTLKRRRSGIIGSLVVQSSNGLYYRINDSIMQAARKNGYECLTMEARPGAFDEKHLIQNFIGLQVDGLVITSNPFITPEMFVQLRASGTPVVAVERGYLDQGIDSLLVEDFEAARDAVLRIAERGHRRIAILARSSSRDVERKRLEGYQAAIHASGALVDERLVCIVENYSPESGRRAAEALFALPEPPTAIFATADTLAAGVLQAAYARRLRVPEDFSLVGYDDVVSRSLSPAIDSVGLSLENVGDQVMELLMARRENPDRTAESRPIHTIYMDRGSVAQL